VERMNIFITETSRTLTECAGTWTSNDTVKSDYLKKFLAAREVQITFTGTFSGTFKAQF